MAALEWAMNNDINIINMSLGGTQNSSILHNAIRQAKESGIIIVAAAGNFGAGASPDENTITYPARYDEVISVGAVDENGQAAYFSSHGPELDIVAPGVNILSTANDGTYATMSGTSMAAPHVAGAIAAYKSKHSKATQQEIIDTLFNSATPSSGERNFYGHGMLNVAKMNGITNGLDIPAPDADDVDSSGTNQPPSDENAEQIVPDSNDAPKPDQSNDSDKTPTPSETNNGNGENNTNDSLNPYNKDKTIKLVGCNPESIPFNFSITSFVDNKANVTVGSTNGSTFDITVSLRDVPSDGMGSQSIDGALLTTEISESQKEAMRVEVKTSTSDFQASDVSKENLSDSNGQKSSFTVEEGKSYLFSISEPNGNNVNLYTGTVKAVFSKNTQDAGTVSLKISDTEKITSKIDSIISSNNPNVEFEANPVDTDSEKNEEMSSLNIGTLYEVESNNTPSLADATYNDYHMYGRIYTTNSDTDWYKVSYTSSGSANFWLGNIPAGCDYDLYVYNSSASTLLGYSAGLGSSELVTLNVSAYTTYYVKIVAYSGYSSNYYLFSNKIYPSTPTVSKDVYEPNDYMSSAYSIGNNTTITNANIHTASNPDFYKFYVNTNSTVRVDLTNIPSSCDYDLQLYNSSGSVIASSANGSNNNESIYATLPSGTYYAYVYPYSGYSSVYYRLQVSSTAYNPQYYVYYYGNSNTGGYVPATQVATSGKYLYLQGNTGNLTRSGYVFSGWNTNSSGTGTSYSAGQGIYMPSSNLSLYAKWTAFPRVNLDVPVDVSVGSSSAKDLASGLNSGAAKVYQFTPSVSAAYTITTSPYGGGSSSSDTYLELYNNTNYSPILASNDDYGGTLFSQITYNMVAGRNYYIVFRGYNYNAASGRLVVKRQTTQYTISFSGNGNNYGSVPSQTVNANSYATMPYPGYLQKTGYYFEGWTLNPNGTGTVYRPASSYGPVTSSVTMYAKWTEKTTIVLIPGLMGSRLYYNGDKKWDPTTKEALDMSDPNYFSWKMKPFLLLNEDGIPDYRLSSNRASESDYGAQNAYEAMYVYLKANYSSDKYNVLFYTYDWRLSLDDIVSGNITNQTNLTNFLQGKNNIVIVAHSMGGLVASRFLSESAGNRSRVKKLITIGTPYLGAPKAIIGFETGELLEWFQNIAMAHHFQELSKNLPSAYTLLPTSYYPEVFVSLDSVNKTFTESMNFLKSRIWAKKSDGSVKPMFSKASTVNAGLYSGGQHISQLVDSVYFIGKGIHTKGKAVYKTDLYNHGNPTGLIYFSHFEVCDGDGTVPVVSARNGRASYQNYEYYSTEHQEIVGVDSVLSKVKYVIDSAVGVNSLSVLEQGGQSQSISSYEAAPDGIGKNVCIVTEGTDDVQITDDLGNNISISGEDLINNKGEIIGKLWVINSETKRYQFVLPEGKYKVKTGSFENAQDSEILVLRFNENNLECTQEFQDISDKPVDINLTEENVTVIDSATKVVIAPSSAQ